MGEDSSFKWQDAVGIVGVLSAFGAMAELPLTFRICCFAACALCLPIAFNSHKSWAKWIRWTLSAAVVCLMSLISWFVAHVKSDHAPSVEETAAKPALPLARPEKVQPEDRPTPSHLAHRRVPHPSNQGETLQGEEESALLKKSLDWQNRFAGFVKEWEANQIHIEEFYGRGNADTRFHKYAMDAANTKIYFRDYAANLNELRMQLKGEVSNPPTRHVDYLEAPRWKTETGEGYMTLGEAEDI